MSVTTEDATRLLVMYVQLAHHFFYLLTTTVIESCSSPKDPYREKAVYLPRANVRTSVSIGLVLVLMSF